MNPDTSGTKRRWAIAGGTGIALAAGAAALFRGPTVVPPMPREPVHPIQLQEVSESATVLNEATAMRDLAPLFLPTARNATLQRLPGREPGQTFLEVEAPKLGIADSGWRFDRDLPPLVTVNGKPLENATPLDYLQATAAEASVAGFGRDPRPLPGLELRAAVVEVVRTRDGRVELTHTLAAETKPPTDKSWQPMEFIASVGPAGLVAPLTMAVRSGVDEVDAFFRNYLVRTFLLGERLPPGFYRITVAP